ncbi:nitronate monooxygenase [Bacillus sp. AGMB 02131]|uniref:Probable nitronate monooxygenase n=1 Tax=Peribacillus faecalis TaxID=2772559 RepID=A0A927CVS0_9BACI|nr:nitronate monooxygenase [Peribacillus faecalis]MBD3107966.1 nitronate monooxygenase [Peribacillus faecalis]
MHNEFLEQVKNETVLPVIVSPMFIISKPKMVIESCKSGVIGTFPLLNARTEEQLIEWMEEITGELSRLKVENPDAKIAPWGVNLIVHSSNHRYEGDLEIIKKYQPPIVITSLGKPVKEVEIVHSYGGKVFSDVISTKHAKKAAEAGVDGLVLVCNGAGGHGGTLNPYAFVAEVRQFWDGLIILAGCLTNGRDVLSARALGADFAYMGTRFITTEEAAADEEYKEMIIESTTQDIIYTDAISGVNANFLTKSIIKAGLDVSNLKKKDKVEVVHDEEAKAWKNIWSAGQGVGSITEVQPIAEVVRQLKEEHDHALAELTKVGITS